MEEKEILIAKVTERAQKEAKAQKLNGTQTKLYIDEEVKKAVEEFDSKKETNQAISSINDTQSKGKKENKVECKEKTYMVYTPVPNWCGIIAKVHFAYGKAKVKEGWILNWFKEHGYRVEEVSN